MLHPELPLSLGEATAGLPCAEPGWPRQWCQDAIHSTLAGPPSTSLIRYFEVGRCLSAFRTYSSRSNS
jgi:hypothetical protein